MNTSSDERQRSIMVGGGSLIIFMVVPSQRPIAETIAKARVHHSSFGAPSNLVMIQHRSERLAGE